MESKALLRRQGEMEKPMSMLGTLLVLLIVTVVLLLILIGVIFDRVAQHKQETLRRKRESAQRRSATVLSIEHKIERIRLTSGGPDAGNEQYRISFYPFRISPINRYDMDNYFLMVEWTDPETQSRVTSPTRVMPVPCRCHPGDEVFIYVHPDMREVWLDESYQRLRVQGFFQ
jgi:hypothetical protein